ncbi:LmeA family phospholipid-binding protein [Kitasatospora cinereorecta]|uniref:LmeA family phospholipid-binding protein n=1 Tax=Kitasatospora cinereorecta TaxID=285560 RepID=A0ABW0VEV8_9ACTN
MTRRPTTHPMTRRAMPRRRLLLGLAALTLLLPAGAELTARHLVADRIARAVADRFGATPDVSLGGRPALLDLLDHRLPGVDLTTADARLGRIPHAVLRLHLDGVRLGPAPSLTGSRAEVDVPTASIAAVVADAAPALTLDEARTDPAAGTLVLDLGPGGMVELTLRPSIADSRVTFSVVSLYALGRPAPPEQTAALTSRLATPAPAYPLALTPTSLTVTTTGLHLTLTGGPTDLPRAGLASAAHPPSPPTDG